MPCNWYHTKVTKIRQMSPTSHQKATASQPKALNVRPEVAQESPIIHQEVSKSQPRGLKRRPKVVKKSPKVNTCLPKGLDGRPKVTKMLTKVSGSPPRGLASSSPKVNRRHHAKAAQGRQRQCGLVLHYRIGGGINFCNGLHYRIAWELFR